MVNKKDYESAIINIEEFMLKNDFNIDLKIRISGLLTNDFQREFSNDSPIFETEKFECKFAKGHRKEALFSIMEIVVDELKEMDIHADEIESEFEDYMS